MSNSICMYMPAKNYNSDIRPVHFVYETEFKKMRQPFFYSIYYMHLVTKGTAVLKINSDCYTLKKGDIYFAFPACLYEVDGSDDFEYLYISFMGSGAGALLENLDIDMTSPVYHGFENLIDLWYDSIKRINPKNINALTEGVLLYTISFIDNYSEKASSKKSNDDLILKIVDYIDRHYRDSDMSLKKLADCFSYTEKYLSLLFKKNMNVSFRRYLNRLRIQYAFTLIENGEISVNDIALKCGYCDSTYFSKVFKLQRGITPSEYIKLLQKRDI